MSELLALIGLVLIVGGLVSLGGWPVIVIIVGAALIVAGGCAPHRAL